MAASLECIRVLLVGGLFSIAFLALTAPGADALKFLKAAPLALHGFLGMNTDINCSTDNPNANVTLLHQPTFTIWEEKPLTPNKLILNEQVFTLLNLDVNDAGRYNCKATDGQQTIRWPQFYGMMVLSSGSLPDYFVLIPKVPVIVLRGRDAQITCETEGTTVSKLHWKKQTGSGEINVPESMVTNEKDQEKNLVRAILKITNAQPQDGGSYKCLLTANNKRAQLLTSIRVDGAGPLKFLKPAPLALHGFLGMNRVINCSTNNPNATVTLLHHPSFTYWEERPLKPNKLVLNGQVFTLLNVDVNDAGRYNCKATDGQQTIRWPQFYGIMVLSLASLPDYFVLKPEKPIVMLKGQDANVTCESEGVSLTKLQWRKQTISGEVTVPDSMATHVKDRSTNRVKAILKITNAQMKDNGVYRCVVKVFENTDYKSTKIVIEDN